MSIVQGGKRTLSFMSQTLGLMADADIGTDHLRWMGSTRFAYGYLRGGEWGASPARISLLNIPGSRGFQTLSGRTLHQGRPQ